MKIKKNADVRHLGTLHTRWMHLIETGVLIRASAARWEGNLFSQRDVYSRWAVAERGNKKISSGTSRRGKTVMPDVHNNEK